MRGRGRDMQIKQNEVGCKATVLEKINEQNTLPSNITCMAAATLNTTLQLPAPAATPASTPTTLRIRAGTISTPALRIPPYRRDDPNDPKRDPAATNPKTFAHSPCPNFCLVVLLTK